MPTRISMLMATPMVTLTAKRISIMMSRPLNGHG
jgi:hypothetical protein